MDPKEVRERRRAKVLARAGVTPDQVEVQKEQELSVKEKLIIAESLEAYQKKTSNYKNAIIIILSIILGYIPAIGYRYNIVSFFLAALLPYKLITVISFYLLTPLPPVHTIEKLSKLIEVLIEIISDVTLFVFSFILSTVAWVPVLEYI
ncbi:unnamed protein product [Blepharisma stoltei]|uniref:Uncharacterized protein n=1 Tax=Blepharisma stoltei TaxID=1481888 RepID=A0AAU9K1Y2_9CILI|nr:unnamed protein product [Blepharisma stoltei]